MKTIKVTLFLIAGLTALPTHIQTEMPSQSVLQTKNEQSSWLSRHKGKIVVAAVLTGGCIYGGIQFIGFTKKVIDTIAKDPKVQEATKKVVATANIVEPRYRRHLEEALSLDLKARITRDLTEHSAEMLKIIGQEAAGISCRFARLTLSAKKRAAFIGYDAENARLKALAAIAKKLTKD
ncbi:MAG TPA: hypothetical protein VGT41_02355 [Candidatus Babeliales bacterium]|nr:hypothetical protein [Candidatus Babeliales bacterium]